MDPKDRLKKEIFEAIANIANDAIEDSDGIEDHTSDYDHDDFITRDDMDDYTTRSEVRGIISDHEDLVSASSVKDLESDFKERIEGFNERVDEFNKKASLFRYEMDTRIANCEQRCKELGPIISTSTHSNLNHKVDEMQKNFQITIDRINSQIVKLETKAEQAIEWQPKLREVLQIISLLLPDPEV